jgi:hypothetical protein
METNDLHRSDDDFSLISRAEQLETFGGLYRGPILPNIWVQCLMEALKKRED